MKHLRLSLLITNLFSCLALSAEFPFSMTPNGSENYREAFYFIADLDDGSYFHVGISTHNFGFGDNHGMCKLTWVPAEEAAIIDIRRSDDWSSTKTSLEIADCRVQATAGGIDFFVKLEDLEFAFSLSGGFAIQSPSAAEAELGGEFLQYEVLVHNQETTIHMVSPAGKRAVKAMIFSDHSRATLAPTKISKGWIRFRGFSRSDQGVLLGCRLSLEDELICWLYTRYPDELNPITIKKITGFPEERPDELPKASLRLEGTDGYLTLDSVNYLLQYEPLQKLGFLGALVRPIIGNPVTFTYHAQIKIYTEEGVVEQKGIMEITHLGI